MLSEFVSEFVSTDTATRPLSEGLTTEPPSSLPDTAEGWPTLAPISALSDEPIIATPSAGELALLPTELVEAEQLATEKSLDVNANNGFDPLLGEALLTGAKQTLADFMRSPTSPQSLAFAFGESDPLPQAPSLVQQFIEGRMLPKIAVLPTADLAAQGAYAAQNETIYLAKELFGQPEKLLQVFMEELGHFIDDHRGATDAPGDEGALFAAEVLGEELTETAIAALKAEDDTGTLTLGDQTLQVEQADLEPGTFTVGAEGQITVEFLVDGGAYQGQLAVFNLDGMEGFTPGSTEFIQEAARRALSNSPEGYVVINDVGEGASLSGKLGERDRNSGDAAGVKTGTFSAGSHFAIMLVPNGTVAEVFNNPTAGGQLRPLFSLASANPNSQVHLAEIRPGMYAMEDVRADAGSDRDYNDVIFLLQGATAAVEAIENLAGNQQIWLNTPFGQQLVLLPEDLAIPQDDRTNAPADPTDTATTPGDPIFVGSDNPVLPPINGDNLQVSIPDGVAKFNAGNSEAEIAATGAARITFGTQTVYIGTNQVSSINQNPIVASFDSANPDNNWIRTDYEVTGADGRGLGIAWDGNNLYAVFTVDGTQGTKSEDFRRAADDAEQAWLRSYGSGGGAKVSVLGRIDPTNGELLDAAYLSAILSSGNSNTLTVEDIDLNSNGNLVVSAQSFFSPRRPDGSALTQTTPGSSPFAYTVEISPDLKRVIATSAPGWA